VQYYVRVDGRAYAFIHELHVLGIDAWTAITLVVPSTPPIVALLHVEQFLFKLDVLKCENNTIRAAECLHPRVDGYEYECVQRTCLVRDGNTTLQYNSILLIVLLYVCIWCAYVDIRVRVCMHLLSGVSQHHQLVCINLFTNVCCVCYNGNLHQISIELPWLLHV
jgi:hypothetical protein